MTEDFNIGEITLDSLNLDDIPAPDPTPATILGVLPHHELDALANAVGEYSRVLFALAQGLQSEPDVGRSLGEGTGDQIRSWIDWSLMVDGLIVSIPSSVPFTSILI